MELTYNCSKCGKPLLVYVSGTNLVTSEPLDFIEAERIEAEISAYEIGFLFVDSATNDRCPSCGVVLDSDQVAARFDVAIMEGEIKAVALPDDFDGIGDGESNVLH